MAIIRLIMGNQNSNHRNYFIKVVDNIDTGVIQQAYDRAVQLIGFNLIERVATEYDNYRIAENFLAMLESWNFPAVGNIRDNGRYLNTDEYFGMYMFFIKIGYNSIFLENEPFNYELTQDVVPTINIGGVGLME